MGSAIRKINPVFSIGGITITILISSKVGTRVIISNCITILIYSWSIICWLWVVRCWLMIGWGRVNDGFVYYWSRVVYRSWFIHWGWVIDRGSMVRSTVVYWSVVSVSWSVNWDMGRSMDGCSILFSGIRVMHVLRSSMGLAGDNGVVTTMGLVDRVAHSRGVAMLDDLMAGLVSQSNCQKARDCDKSLKHNLLLIS